MKKSWSDRASSACTGQYCDQDFFISLRSAERTEEDLKDAMLASAQRRLTHIPTTSPTPAGWHAAQWPKGTVKPVDVKRRIAMVREAKVLTDMTELLVALDAYESTRPKNMVLAGKFEWSSALWASKYKFANGRKPVLDDWFVVFPRTKSRPLTPVP